MIKFEGYEIVPKKLEKQFYYAENLFNTSLYEDVEDGNLKFHYGDE